MKEYIKLFGAYVKRNIFALIVYIATVVIFAVVLFLYSAPTPAVRYAAFLSFAVTAALSVIRFFYYCKKHRSLEEINRRADISLDNLPPCEDIIESDYQQIAHTLLNNARELKSTDDVRFSDMLDYFTMWTHQIKTPIAAMKLILEEENPDTDEMAEQLFKTEQYVETVLQYMRLDGEASDFVFRITEVDDVIRQAVRKYRRQFIRRKLSLNFTETGIHISTDEKWLCFVIEQLLSNSLKYTKSGSISIYADRDFPCTLVIEDTGIGIGDEDLPRVFDKGFTGFNGRADKKSTGIGLFLCKRILTKLSHTISITSEKGTGTKVYIGLGRNNGIIE